MKDTNQDIRVIATCGPTPECEQALAKLISDEPCQPNHNDYDVIEDWKGSGKRKMKRAK